MGKLYKFDYRDVSGAMQMLRELLLGRRHTLHGRFAPGIAPRSVPPPIIPRGPQSTTSYSRQYYYNRSLFDSVLPPAVAPVAEGRSDPYPMNKDHAGKQVKADTITFFPLPTPGKAWWWDGHCYYEYVEHTSLALCNPQTKPPPVDCSDQGPYK